MVSSTWSDGMQGALSKSSTSYAILQFAVLAIAAGAAYHFTTRSKKQPLFPVWATLEIGLTSYILSAAEDGLGRRIISSLRRNGGSLFGLSSTHQILVNLPGVDRLMSHSVGAVSSAPISYTLVTRVFGATPSPGFRQKLETSFKSLNAPIEKVFVSDASSIAALERANIHEYATSFVTFSSNVHDKKRWEHSSHMRIIPSNSSEKPTSVEVDFQSLVRDFGACIAIPTLYGAHFLNRYPQALEDLWKFDNDLFPLLMIGIPRWAPLKVVKEGVAAQKRLLRELEAFHRRVSQYRNGEPVDFDDDMSDISSVPLARSKILDRDGWSSSERAPVELGLFWGQNANTQPMLFWLLTYAYSTPGVIENIREEVAPYMEFSQATPKEMTSLDVAGLTRHCQFLKACIFETYRLANEPTSIRYVSRSVTIEDGKLTHELQPGMFVSAPHAIDSLDASVYANPDKFDPTRFLQHDAESGKSVARYGKLKPWGVGAAMCKGRTFAEKELLSVGAAIIALWDVEPASGVWEIPASLPGTGVKKPVKDIRVVVSRRNW